MNLQFGKKNDQVGTPEYFLEWLVEENFLEKDFFDPCPLKRPDWDGLEVPWKKSNFVNPPYSEVKKWLEKGLEERKKGNKSVFLIPARTSSKYWFDSVWRKADDLVFLEGGIVFKGYENPLPVPLVLVIFDPKVLKERKGIKFRDDKKKYFSLRENW